VFPISGVGREFAHHDSADNTERQYRTEQIENQEQDEPLCLFVQLQKESGRNSLESNVELC
jgi:predicted lipase